MASEFRPPTGHVFRVERTHGPAWYAKYRLPAGRQVEKKLGPAWAGRGRPPAGYFTKRLAEDWLRDVLEQARRGSLPGMVRTGATFADAAAEYLRYIEYDRGRKPSTLRGYRSAIEAHLLPAFGSMPVEAVTTEEIERWIAGFDGSVRARNKPLIELHGILGRARRVYGLPGNAAADVEKFPQRRSGDIEVFSPEDVWALVRAAAADQDAAIFLRTEEGRRQAFKAAKDRLARKAGRDEEPEVARLELDPKFSAARQGRRAWHREGRRVLQRQREQAAKPIARSRAERLLETLDRLEENRRVQIQAWCEFAPEGVRPTARVCVG